MASCFSHPAVPLALACWFPSLRRPSVLIAASLLSVAPDLDGIGYYSGIPYEAWCGHRGFTHSLVVSLFVGMLVAIPMSRYTRLPMARLSAFFAFSAASHGLIDMATNGGLGISLLWPFSQARLFWPAQPIEVAPIEISAFFSEWGSRVLISEFFWIWLPAIAIGAAGLLFGPKPAMRSSVL